MPLQGGISNEGARLDWRRLDRTALDRGYNNRAAVANSEAIVTEWKVRSSRLRQSEHAALDLRYGPRPRNTIDFLRAHEGAPTLVFLHGGYWQSREKETFTFIAEGPLANGISVALVGYTLAPDASLDEIVGEARAAIDFLGATFASSGGDPEALWVCGWSAGAHLATMMLDHGLVRGGLAVSGIYDLEPIAHCYINENLRLDASAARRNSPLLNLPQHTPPLTIVVGGDELPLIRQQSTDYAEARRRHGLPTTFQEIAGANHFTILDELSAANGALTLALRDLIAQS